MDLEETGCKDVKCIRMPQERVQRRAVANMVTNLRDLYRGLLAYQEVIHSIKLSQLLGWLQDPPQYDNSRYNMNNEY